MDETTKLKIKQLVATYKEVHPEEYIAVVDQIRITRGMQDDEFASTGGDHVVEQKLYEVPETLFAILKFNLSSDQLKELYSKAGARWFARTFREFATAIKI